MPELSILICTFRRPAWLVALLHALRGQEGPCPAHEIIVVDNDADLSSSPLHHEFPEVRWLHEPRPGVSHARNLAVRSARGPSLLLLDDDQLLASDALTRLWAEWQTRPDGITGLRLPVRRWTGDERPPREGMSDAGMATARPAPGARVGRPDFGTGGLMVDATLFTIHGLHFEPAYGLSGGEDTELFVRASAVGAVFAWSATEVMERVPPARATMGYRATRQFRAGRIDGDIDARHGVVLRRLPLDQRIARWASGEAVTALSERAARWWRNEERWGVVVDLLSYRLGRIAQRLETCWIRSSGRGRSVASERWR